MPLGAALYSWRVDARGRCPQTSPMAADHYDLIVVGGGAAGLVTAGGAAQLGARTLLIERHRLGGECLYTGCVPSKTLLAAAAQGSDWPTARAAVARAISTIEPHDSPERFAGFGVEVLTGDARFTGRTSLDVAGRALTARRFVIATGSDPVVPPVLAGLPVLTNETIWNLAALPSHLIILGGGAIGCELGQAFKRLGSQVTVVEQQMLLGGSDQDAVAVLRQRLLADGVVIHEGAAAKGASHADSSIRLTLADGTAIAGSHILAAAGRRARTSGLGLDAAGVTVGRDGIEVDRHGRTSNRRIFAAGDCRAGPRLTHAADLDARAVIQNALFPIQKSIEYKALPAVVYTSPEVAQLGLTAIAAPGAEVWRHDFDHNDRAVTDGDVAGFVKIIAKGNRVLGMTIVGAHAGELLPVAGLAVAGKLSLSDLANQILPYPTRAEAIRFAAEQRGQARLFTPMMRRITRLFQRLP